MTALLGWEVDVPHHEGKEADGTLVSRISLLRGDNTAVIFTTINFIYFKKKEKDKTTITTTENGNAIYPITNILLLQHEKIIFILAVIANNVFTAFLVPIFILLIIYLHYYCTQLDAYLTAT